MQVKIGKYTNNYINSYRIGLFLEKIGLSEAKADAISDWLETNRVFKYLQKLDNARKRKVKIKIDKFDTWSMDHTLSLIIHPMLVQLKKTKNGAPFVDDQDVPDNLKSTNAKPKENEWDTDEFHFDRWDWVLDEMIWAIEQIATDHKDEPELFKRTKEDWTETVDPDNPSLIKVDFNLEEIPGQKQLYNQYHDRIRKGCALFGKYFQNLWD